MRPPSRPEERGCDSQSTPTVAVWASSFGRLRTQLPRGGVVVCSSSGTGPDLGPELAARPGTGDTQLADCLTSGKAGSNSPNPRPRSLCQTAWLPTPLSKPQSHRGTCLVFTVPSCPFGYQASSDYSHSGHTHARPWGPPKSSPQPESPTLAEGPSHGSGHEQAQVSLQVTNPQLLMSPPSWVGSALLSPGALLDSHCGLSILQSAPPKQQPICTHMARHWASEEHLTPSAHCCSRPLSSSHDPVAWGHD